MVNKPLLTLDMVGVLSDNHEVFLLLFLIGCHSSEQLQWISAETATSLTRPTGWSRSLFAFSPLISKYDGKVDYI